MKKALVLSFCFSFVLMAMPSMTNAQDTMSPKKYVNPQWKRVVMIDYKPGKNARAREIIMEYFVKANEKSGVPGPSLVVEFQTGSWDTMAVWDMQEGVESMNWDVSPDNIKWFKALSEICGGDDKARAIQEEYSSCVARSSSEIGRLR